ncbi:MAG: hypothetical protein H8D67_16820 [Deltaproteobacteria bacterium]|nr:hypothetical protein [Deltaproteobacteria bacterium]
MLNKSKGNMYPFVTHTWNTIKGKCPHDCAYCYMKRFGEQPPLHFDEKELKTDLGEGNFIFVGSSCDMFASDILLGWIVKTLIHCREFENKYLFQTKNPGQIMDYMLPPSSIVGTTIETNRKYPQMGKTDSPQNRVRYMNRISYEYKTMVTIEPIMDFDLVSLVDFVEDCHPEWVNIGADSQGHNLPEPPAKKIEQLIIELEKFTKVKIKPNLKRLLTT